MHFYLILLFKIDKYPAYVVYWCILTFEANATKMMAMRYKNWMYFMKYYIIWFNSLLSSLYIRDTVYNM